MSGRAVFAEIPYRPPLLTPRPVIDGFQSAMVVGPKGQEIHTDEFGRVRVQFHWDREGKSDENSSCWIRVSQGWGGAGWGMHILPRIGQEVLVNFLEGDPDQPVVLGRAYNSIEPVPYRLPENKTISTWKSDSTLGSNGFNEIKFEDKAGEEYFYVQAERNLRKLVKNDETITVLRDRRKGVVGHETDTTGVNRTEVTGVNRIDITGQWRILFVGGKRAQWIKGKETERTQGYLKRLVKGGADSVVKGKKRERVEDDVHLSVTGDRRERIDGKQSLTVLEDQHEKVGQNHALETGKAIHFVAGEDAVGEGGVEVAVKGPGGFIAIDASGVSISGNVVKINAGGSPGKGKGSKPEPPEEAEVALVGVPKLPRGNDKGLPAGEDWVEVSLLDDADPPAPVPFARYRVESDDGVVHEGLLDAQGKAIVTGVKPGKCKVSFPDLDGASWGEKK
jgi:type VI secretion system secreted protein VgrG